MIRLLSLDKIFYVLHYVPIEKIFIYDKQIYIIMTDDVPSPSSKSKSKNKREVHVYLSEDLYKRVKELRKRFPFLTVSDVVEHALERFLQDIDPEELSIMEKKYTTCKKIITEVMLQGNVLQVDAYTLKMAITKLRGSNRKTIKKWMETLTDLGFLKPITKYTFEIKTDFDSELNGIRKKLLSIPPEKFKNINDLKPYIFKGVKVEFKDKIQNPGGISKDKMPDLRERRL